MAPSQPKTRALVITFVAASVVATSIVLGMYFVALAPGSKFGLSSLNQDWALFGDYLGGTLGTLFSLLAFFGVLCTIWLQAAQLDLASKQSQLDEIQRVLATVSARLDQLLTDPVNHQFKSYPLRTEPADYFRVLSAGGTAALSLPTSDWMRQAQLSQLIDECKSALAPQTSVVGIELDQLAWLLDRYTQHGGATSVVEFYKRRYTAVICWLNALGFLAAHPYVDTLFAPGSLRESLTPVPE